jgi:hypothetical protein
MHINSQR